MLWRDGFFTTLIYLLYILVGCTWSLTKLRLPRLSSTLPPRIIIYSLSNSYTLVIEYYVLNNGITSGILRHYCTVVRTFELVLLSGVIYLTSVTLNRYRPSFSSLVLQLSPLVRPPPRGTFRTFGDVWQPLRPYLMDIWQFSTRLLPRSHTDSLSRYVQKNILSSLYPLLQCDSSKDYRHPYYPRSYSFQSTVL